MRQEIQARLEAAEVERDPLAVRALAADLRRDCFRLLARLEQTEMRLDSLDVAGKLTTAAESEGMRLLVSLERALTAARGTWANLAARFPAYEPTPEAEAESLALGVDRGDGRVEAVIIRPGASTSEIRAALNVEYRPPDESEE